MKRFPFNYFHTVDAVLLVKSQENRPEVQKGNSDSSEFPEVSRRDACIQTFLYTFLAFPDYPDFQHYKSAVRQKVTPQARV